MTFFYESLLEQYFSTDDPWHNMCQSLLPAYTQYFIQHSSLRVSSTHKFIRDHQSGYEYNRSTTDQIFFVCQILDGKQEYSGTVHHLYLDFRKAYDSVRILIKFSRFMNLD
jgi:hypothetical protein